MAELCKMAVLARYPILNSFEMGVVSAAKYAI
jgi:hypothetical protein